MIHVTLYGIMFHFVLINDYLDYFTFFLISAFSSQLDLSNCLDSFQLDFISHRQLSLLCHHVLTYYIRLSSLLSYGILRTLSICRTCSCSSFQQVLLLVMLGLELRLSSLRTCRSSSSLQVLLLARLELESRMCSCRTYWSSIRQQVLLLARLELESGWSSL